MSGTANHPITYSSKARRVSPLDWNEWVEQINTRVVSKTSTYTATADDGAILANGTFTVTLPTSAGIKNKLFYIKNTGSGTITIDGDGSETIDGDTSIILESNDSVIIISDDTNWQILSNLVETTTDGWDKSFTITRTNNNITEVAYTGGKTITYTIDSYGKVSSFTDGTKTWTLTRDANGDKITSGVVT